MSTDSQLLKKFSLIAFVFLFSQMAFSQSTSSYRERMKQNLLKTQRREIKSTKITQTKPENTPSNSSYNGSSIRTYRKSDVDLAIPVTGVSNDKTFAVIVGNEDYIQNDQKRAQEIKNVPYAERDADTFHEYITKTIGVPDRQVHLIKNATYGQMLGEIDWLKKVGKSYGGEAKIIFYYAGHGVPDEQSKEAYLLPVDGLPSSTRTAISTKDLYASLSESTVAQATVFLDACFSGSSRDGMITSGRGVRIKPKDESPMGNLVVFSAVSGDQTAHPYDDKGHGLFSYFLLKKLKETKGDVTYKELGDYISDKVNKESVINGKEQTPKINVSIAVQDQWSNWRF